MAANDFVAHRKYKSGLIWIGVGCVVIALLYFAPNADLTKSGDHPKVVEVKPAPVVPDNQTSSEAPPKIITPTSAPPDSTTPSSVPAGDIIENLVKIDLEVVLKTGRLLQLSQEEYRLVKASIDEARQSKASPQIMVMLRDTLERKGDNLAKDRERFILALKDLLNQHIDHPQILTQVLSSALKQYAGNLSDLRTIEISKRMIDSNLEGDQSEDAFVNTLDKYWYY